ncbi:hypothetical protein M3J09_010801 [Ascochyta lentis]
MSVQGNLQRPRSASWKIEAIRRGDLKISGPIPIDEDTPLTDEEEREFAERRGEKRTEERLDIPAPPQHTIRQVPNSQATLRQEDATEETAMKTVSHDRDMARQEAELHDQHPARSPLRSPLGMHPTDGILAGQRESVFQSGSHTPPTPFRATPESTSHANAAAAKKQKRKSGIRGVFRKMFGRKDREESQDRNEEPVRRGHSYHHSDPGLLHKSQAAPQEPPTPNTQRISDLTVKELQPPHPLGQHLPYPMNVNAPPASPPHEYLRFDFPRTDAAPRRATLPNLSGGVAQRHSLDEPRGRLSTWEEKTEDEPLPSPGIGIALSSPPHAARTSLGERRRSRSAGALRELAKARFSNDTRNDVIKTWRESYASASVYSQNTRPQTARTVETVRSVYTKGPSVQEAESIHEGMSATLVGPDELTPNEPTPTAQDPSTPEATSRAQPWNTPEHPPVSAFNFGNLEPSSPHEHTETLAQLEGPPLPSRSPKRLSVEDRVQSLEENIHTLESSLRRISTHNSRQTIILENAPRNLRTRTRSTSRSVSAVSIHQRETLSGAPTSNLAYESSPPSPPLTHSDDKLTKEELAPLHAQLYEERTARLALESRVLALQNEVTALHDLVNKLVNRSTVAATSPNYPTPSPDSIHPTNEDRMPTPRAGRYEARRQGTEDSEVVSPEVWATPKEEGFGEQSNRSGFFHNGETVPQVNGLH